MDQCVRCLQRRLTYTYMLRHVNVLIYMFIHLLFCWSLPKPGFGLLIFLYRVSSKVSNAVIIIIIIIIKNFICHILCNFPLSNSSHVASVCHSLKAMNYFFNKYWNIYIYIYIYICKTGKWTAEWQWSFIKGKYILLVIWMEAGLRL
jgi:hypothetical protein